MLIMIPIFLQLFPFDSTLFFILNSFSFKGQEKQREGLDQSLLCNTENGDFEIVFHAATTTHVEMQMNPEENGK